MGCRPSDRLALLKTAAQDGTSGGRIYDTHIAEVARAAGAKVVITDNRRHFLSALRYGIRVETPSEFVAGLKPRLSRRRRGPAQAGSDSGPSTRMIAAATLRHAPCSRRSSFRPVRVSV